MSEEKVEEEKKISNEENGMIQRISLEIQRREPNTIKELVLDNCARSFSIEGLNDDFCNLRVLSIINVGLQSLNKFPKLPKLKKLYLSDNRLSSGLENLQGCTNLSLLYLPGNKFKSIDQLKPLTKLSKLSILDLMNCEVTKTENYKETMFKMLPQLKYLDNNDKDGVEKDSDNEDEEDEEDDQSDSDEDNDQEEEDESKSDLKCLYDGTFEDDDDEESYQEQSDQDESDEDEDLSDDDNVSADPIQMQKGEKRKRNCQNDDQNLIENDSDQNNDDEPPRKI